jgi:hypothetical protein
MTKTALIEPQDVEVEQVEVPEVPVRRETWAACPSCLHERRTVRGVMSSHRVWIPSDGVTSYGEMVDCPGSGQPAGVTM